MKQTCNYIRYCGRYSDRDPQDILETLAKFITEDGDYNLTDAVLTEALNGLYDLDTIRQNPLNRKSWEMLYQLLIETANRIDEYYSKEA